MRLPKDLSSPYEQKSTCSFPYLNRGQEYYYTSGLGLIFCRNQKNKTIRLVFLTYLSLSFFIIANCNFNSFRQYIRVCVRNSPY